MTTKQVPTAWKHECDYCGSDKVTCSAKVPVGWGRLTIEEPLYTDVAYTSKHPELGSVSAGTSRVDLELCARCLTAVKVAIDNSKEERIEK